MQTSEKTSRTSRNKSRTARNGRTALFLALLFMAASTGCLLAYTLQRLRTPAIPVTSAEAAIARSAYYASAPNRMPSFSDAPDLSAWKGLAAEPADESEPVPSRAAVSGEVNARSAILVDASSGSVLFEKNADERIPPASMTKLVAIYTAFHAVENGEISLDDEVTLPPESWAVNIPRGSSLMFLGAGQHVTVRELLLGMAVVSGNDAAIALADHISGSVPAYVARMNHEMEKLGLNKTRFVEPSGLSEQNLTTAREFADFSLVYIREYPEALRALHSRPGLSYPEQWNLPAGSHEHPVVQKATNHLLGVLEGCDGLKTGFIRESGYNFSLTAERNGNRFISVTMGGSGTGSHAGSLLRAKDGTLLMEWAFTNFRTIKPAKIKPVTIPVWAGTVPSLEAIPAGNETFTVPAKLFEGTTPKSGNEETADSGNGSKKADAKNSTTISVSTEKVLRAPIHAGDIIGSVNYSVNGKVVHSVPLVADRSIAEAGIMKRILDGAAEFVARIAK